MTTKRILGSLIFVAAIIVFAFIYSQAVFGPSSGDTGFTPPWIEEGEIVSADEIQADDMPVNSEGTPIQVSNSLPSRLSIPKIGVNAPVHHLGVTSEGLMAVPPNFTDVGWYRYGPKPGQKGSAVIAGHQDNALGRPAIFFELEDLQVGDSVYLEAEDGTKLEFKVIRTEVVPYNLQGPKLEEIFNGQGGRYLNLITCAGSWLASAKTNDLRLIVYTELVG